MDPIIPDNLENEEYEMAIERKGAARRLRGRASRNSRFIESEEDDSENDVSEMTLQVKTLPENGPTSQSGDAMNTEKKSAKRPIDLLESGKTLLSLQKPRSPNTGSKKKRTRVEEVQTSVSPSAPSSSVPAPSPASNSSSAASSSSSSSAAGRSTTPAPASLVAIDLNTVGPPAYGESQSKEEISPPEDGLARMFRGALMPLLSAVSKELREDEQFLQKGAKGLHHYVSTNAQKHELVQGIFNAIYSFYSGFETIEAIYDEAPLWTYSLPELEEYIVHGFQNVSSKNDLDAVFDLLYKQCTRTPGLPFLERVRGIIALTSELSWSAKIWNKVRDAENVRDLITALSEEDSLARVAVTTERELKAQVSRKAANIIMEYRTSTDQKIKRLEQELNEKQQALENVGNNSTGITELHNQLDKERQSRKQEIESLKARLEIDKKQFKTAYEGKIRNIVEEKTRAVEEASAKALKLETKNSELLTKLELSVEDMVELGTGKQSYDELRSLLPDENDLKGLVKAYSEIISPPIGSNLVLRMKISNFPFFRSIADAYSKVESLLSTTTSALESLQTAGNTDTVQLKLKIDQIETENVGLRASLSRVSPYVVTSENLIYFSSVRDVNTKLESATTDYISKLTELRNLGGGFGKFSFDAIEEIRVLENWTSAKDEERMNLSTKSHLRNTVSLLNFALKIKSQFQLYTEDDIVAFVNRIASVNRLRDVDQVITWMRTSGITQFVHLADNYNSPSLPSQTQVSDLTDLQREVSFATGISAKLGALKTKGGALKDLADVLEKEETGILSFERMDSRARSTFIQESRFGSLLKRYNSLVTVELELEDHERGVISSNRVYENRHVEKIFGVSEKFSGVFAVFQQLLLLASSLKSSTAIDEKVRVLRRASYFEGIVKVGLDLQAYHEVSNNIFSFTSGANVIKQFISNVKAIKDEAYPELMKPPKLLSESLEGETLDIVLISEDRDADTQRIAKEQGSRLSVLAEKISYQNKQITEIRDLPLTPVYETTLASIDDKLKIFEGKKDRVSMYISSVYKTVSNAWKKDAAELSSVADFLNVDVDSTSLDAILSSYSSMQSTRFGNFKTVIKTAVLCINNLRIEQKKLDGEKSILSDELEKKKDKTLSVAEKDAEVGLAIRSREVLFDTELAKVIEFIVNSTSEIEAAHKGVSNSPRASVAKIGDARLLLTTAIAEIKSAYSTLEGRLASSSSISAALTSEVKKLEGELKTKVEEKEKTITRDVLSQLNPILEEIQKIGNVDPRSDESDINTCAAAIARGVEKLSIEYNSFQRKVEQFSKENTQLKTELEAKKTEITEQLKQIRDIGKLSNTQLETLRSIASAVKYDGLLLSGSLETKAEELMDTIEKLTSQVDTITDELKVLRENKDLSSEQTDDLRKELLEKKREITEQLTTIKDLGEINKSQLETLQSIASAVGFGGLSFDEKLATEVKQLIKKMEDLTSEVNTLTRDLSDNIQKDYYRLGREILKQRGTKRDSLINVIERYSAKTLDNNASEMLLIMLSAGVCLLMNALRVMKNGTAQPSYSPDISLMIPVFDESYCFAKQNYAFFDTIEGLLFPILVLLDGLFDNNKKETTAIANANHFKPCPLGNHHVFSRVKERAAWKQVIVDQVDMQDMPVHRGFWDCVFGSVKLLQAAASYIEKRSITAKDLFASEDFLKADPFGREDDADYSHANYLPESEKTMGITISAIVHALIRYDSDRETEMENCTLGVKNGSIALRSVYNFNNDYRVFGAFDGVEELKANALNIIESGDMFEWKKNGKASLYKDLDNFHLFWKRIFGAYRLLLSSLYLFENPDSGNDESRGPFFQFQDYTKFQVSTRIGTNEVLDSSIVLSLYLAFLNMVNANRSNSPKSIVINSKLLVWSDPMDLEILQEGSSSVALRIPSAVMLDLNTRQMLPQLPDTGTLTSVVRQQLFADGLYKILLAVQGEALLLFSEVIVLGEPNDYCRLPFPQAIYSLVEQLKAERGSILLPITAGTALLNKFNALKQKEVFEAMIRSNDPLFRLVQTVRLACQLRK